MPAPCLPAFIISAWRLIPIPHTGPTSAAQNESTGGEADAKDDEDVQDTGGLWYLSMHLIYFSVEYLPKQGADIPKLADQGSSSLGLGTGCR